MSRVAEVPMSLQIHVDMPLDDTHERLALPLPPTWPIKVTQIHQNSLQQILISFDFITRYPCTHLPKGIIKSYFIILSSMPKRMLCSRLVARRSSLDPHFAWLTISAYMSSGILPAKLIATPIIFCALRPGRFRRMVFGLPTQKTLAMRKSGR